MNSLCHYYLLGILTLLAISTKNAVNAEAICVSSCAPNAPWSSIVDNDVQCCVMGAGGYVPLLTTPTTEVCQSCDDLISIQPRIETSVTPSPIQINSSAQFTCDIFSFINNLNVEGTIQWLGPSGNVLEESGPNIDSLDLDFDPFEIDDAGDYKCVAQVSSPDLPAGIPPVVASSVVRIESLDSSPVTIPDTPPPTVGESFTLTCTLNQEGQTIEWLDSDGNVITSDGNITVGPTMSGGGMTTSTLTFNTLRTSDTGYYTCRNPIQNVTRRIITRFQTPEATISQPVDLPTIGQPFQPECFGSSDIPGATVEVFWIGPDGSIIAMQSSTSGNVTLLLPIMSLSESDIGMYECRTQVTSPFVERNVVARDTFSLQGMIPTTAEPLTPSETTQPPATTITASTPSATDPTLSPTDPTLSPTDPTLPPTDPADTTTPRELINECELGLDNCSRREICTYSYRHRRGHRRGRNCTRVATCIDTDEGFECECNDGFQGDGTTCTDIDECADEADNNCLPDAKCINKMGSFRCRCRRGYIGDGIECCVRERDIRNFLDAQSDDEETTHTKTTKKTKTTGGTKSSKRNCTNVDDDSTKTTRSSKSKCDSEEPTAGPLEGLGDNCIESTKTTKSSGTTTGSKCVNIAELMLDDSCKAVIEEYINKGRRSKSRRTKKKSRKSRKSKSRKHRG